MKRIRKEIRQLTKKAAERKAEGKLLLVERNHKHHLRSAQDRLCLCEKGCQETEASEQPSAAAQAEAAL